MPKLADVVAAWRCDCGVNRIYVYRLADGTGNAFPEGGHNFYVPGMKFGSHYDAAADAFDDEMLVDDELRGFLDTCYYSVTECTPAEMNAACAEPLA